MSYTYLKQSFVKHLHDFKKLGSNEKIGIAGILAGCFFVGYFVTRISAISLLISPRLQNKSAPAQSSANKKPGTATLSFSSQTATVAKGSQLVVNIGIDSPTDGIEAADFVVTYDPKVLKAVSVSPGNYFGSYPIQKISDGSVKLSGVASLQGDRLIVNKGKGTVGTIIFTALKSTQQTIIRFEKTKTITASAGKNIAGVMNELAVSIR